jgi:hypothetical protein
MTANAHGSGEPAPGRPDAAVRARAVRASLFQPVTVPMKPRLRSQRSLRAIEQDLAASDPSLTRLFSYFTLLAQGEERGPAQESKTQPLRALARWLARALEFDPADPYRRSPTALRGGRRAGS